MRIAYFDCVSGVSGDMILGSMVDAGMPAEVLVETVSHLGLEDECRIEVGKVLKNGISGTKVTVELRKKQQKARGLLDVENIIRGSTLSPSVRNRSIKVFQRLAKAEASVHGCSPDEVHFHEVGAVDSIVDIVGAVAGLEALKVGHVYASALPLGSGFVKTQHGNIPLPSPATVELLRGVPVYDSHVLAEMVTPTGAALLTEFVMQFGQLPAMRISNIGYGAGTREIPDRPNLLRLIIGEPVSSDAMETEMVAVLETTIDDSSPEFLGYVMECLLESGALDVAFFPAQMKKNRPGVQVQVIARPNEVEKFSGIIFGETTTLGVRYRFEQRMVHARTSRMIDSQWGKIKVKEVRRGHEVLLVPEYEECRRIARQHNIPLRDVYAWVLTKGRDILGKE